MPILFLSFPVRPGRWQETGVQEIQNRCGKAKMRPALQRKRWAQMSAVQDLEKTYHCRGFFGLWMMDDAAHPVSDAKLE